MQRKVAHLLLMGAQDRLQAAIDALLRDLHPASGQRISSIFSESITRPRERSSAPG
jgi:tRNA A37 threonylcarbamoyladenosine dehydratase